MARQPVHRETRDVGVQISGTHADECTSSRPGKQKSHLTDRSSGLVRPNTHTEALLRVASWVTIPGGVGVDREFKRGSFLISLFLLLHSHRADLAKRQVRGVQESPEMVRCCLSGRLNMITSALERAWRADSDKYIVF